MDIFRRSYRYRECRCGVCGKIIMSQVGSFGVPKCTHCEKMAEIHKKVAAQMLLYRRKYGK